MDACDRLLEAMDTEADAVLDALMEDVPNVEAELNALLGDYDVMGMTERAALAAQAYWETQDGGYRQSEGQGF